MRKARLLYLIDKYEYELISSTGKLTMSSLAMGLDFALKANKLNLLKDSRRQSKWEKI